MRNTLQGYGDQREGVVTMLSADSARLLLLEFADRLTCPVSRYLQGL